MKQEDIGKAKAIVSIFETGKPSGNYGALVVLNDGAGISFGVKQFTHRSGSLLQVVEKYLATDASAGRETIQSRLPLLRRSTKLSIETLAADERFKQALKAAAKTMEMQAAQDAVATERYMAKALAECKALGLTLPLSLAVVYDSVVHGSWLSLSGYLGPVRDEKTWIKRYVEHRHEWLKGIARLRTTTYRTNFFLRETARCNWQMKLPMYVHGYLLKESDLHKAPSISSPTDSGVSSPTDSGVSSPTVREGAVQIPSGLPTDVRVADTTALPQPPATVPPDTPPGPDQKSRDPQVAAPTFNVDAENVGRSDAGRVADALENKVNDVAARVDQAERIVVTTTTRTDKAKSLWATVAGTLWQMAWAVGGFLAGVPREVWLVVAIIAAVLVSLFIYRQITLGRLREQDAEARTSVRA